MHGGHALDVGDEAGEQIVLMAEEHVLFRREVVEERARRHLGGLGDRLDRGGPRTLTAAHRSSATDTRRSRVARSSAQTVPGHRLLLDLHRPDNCSCCTIHANGRVSTARRPLSGAGRGHLLDHRRTITVPIVSAAAATAVVAGRDQDHRSFEEIRAAIAD